MAALSKPYIFSIPPELRIRIYEFALVSHKTINVTKKKYRPQPALLATCHQIRDEAASVYYQSNTFRYTVCNYAGVLIIPFCKPLRKYRTDHKGNAISVKLCGHAQLVDFNNLYSWLSIYHADPDLVPAPPQDQLATGWTDKDIAIRLFSVVYAMRCRTWAEIGDVLDSFRDMMLSCGVTTPPWLACDLDDEELEEQYQHEYDSSDNEAQAPSGTELIWQHERCSWTGHEEVYKSVSGPGG